MSMSWEGDFNFNNDFKKTKKQSDQDIIREIYDIYYQLHKYNSSDMGVFSKEEIKNIKGILDHSTERFGNGIKGDENILRYERETTIDNIIKE